MLVSSSTDLSQSPNFSNTFNPDFYRGDPNSANFYTKIIYDYFSIDGRRMGAHSGTSSDDLIFINGLARGSSMLFISYNRERHGIKTMNNPEIKTEISATYKINYKVI